MWKTVFQRQTKPADLKPLMRTFRSKKAPVFWYFRKPALFFCIFPPCAHYPWACYHAGRPVEGQRRTSPSPIFEGCHEQGRFTSGGCSLVRGVWHTPQVREL